MNATSKSTLAFALPTLIIVCATAYAATKAKTYITQLSDEQDANVKRIENYRKMESKVITLKADTMGSQASIDEFQNHFALWKWGEPYITASEKGSHVLNLCSNLGAKIISSPTRVFEVPDDPSFSSHGYTQDMVSKVSSTSINGTAQMRDILRLAADIEAEITDARPIRLNLNKAPGSSDSELIFNATYHFYSYDKGVLSQ